MGPASASGFLLMGGGALILAGTALLGPATGNGSGPSALPSATPSASPSYYTAPTNCDPYGNPVRYAAVRDSHKRYRYAFANPVNADQGTDAITDSLSNAATHDPIRASGVLALVQRNVSDINNRPPNLVGDKQVWCEDVSSALRDLRNQRASVEDVDKGAWKLVAVPESGLDENVPVRIYQTRTTATEQAIMYAYPDRFARFLLGDGFAPVQAVKFDGIPVLPASVTPSASPSASRSSGSSRGSGSAAPGTVNHDPHHNGGARQGGGTNPGLNGSAAPPSGEPSSSARRTNPPRPSTTASSGSNGGGSGQGSGGTTGQTSASRPSPTPSSTAQTDCVVVPGVEDCSPLTN